MDKSCIVIGAGGHAKVVIEILRAQGMVIDYCISTDKDQKSCLDVPILFGDENIKSLRQQGYTKAFIAIGNNLLREKLALSTLALGYELLNAISPQATVSPSVILGKGIAIMAGCIINAEVHLENFCIINTGATVDHDCRIGQSAHIAPQCGLAGNVHIGNKAFLGIGCKVIPNITIGDTTTVGAGSVVIHDLPSSAKAYGSPAKIVDQGI